MVSDRLQSKQEAVKYDVNPYNPLFDGLQMVPTAGKSSMVEELDAYLKDEHRNEDVEASATMKIALTRDSRVAYVLTLTLV